MSQFDTNHIPEIIVPRDQAVFWLDKNGHWQNKGGQFRLKKIVRHFNESIAKDEGGYYVTQENCGRLEKVYFPYEDTALFAIDIQQKSERTVIRLNTGKRLPLQPDRIFHLSDNLYTKEGEEWIKFTERCLLKLAPMIDTETDPWQLHFDGSVYPVPERS